MRSKRCDYERTVTEINAKGEVVAAIGGSRGTAYFDINDDNLTYVGWCAIYNVEYRGKGTYEAWKRCERPTSTSK